LPFSLVAFPPERVAVAASIFRPDKDLQHDKEGYATGVTGKRDMNVV